MGAADIDAHTGTKVKSSLFQSIDQAQRSKFHSKDCHLTIDPIEEKGTSHAHTKNNSSYMNKLELDVPLECGQRYDSGFESVGG
jgi:hypothetical protein